MTGHSLTPLEKASAIVGSQRELASQLNITEGSVSLWKTNGVPPRKCLEIEHLTGGKVTVHDLRPDIFGAERIAGALPANPAPRIHTTAERINAAFQEGNLSDADMAAIQFIAVRLIGANLKAKGLSKNSMPLTKD